MAEYIEREALVHHFMTTKHYLTKDLVMDAAYEISKFPAADVVEVRHGRWIHRKSWDKWVCSECSSEENRPRKHCSECGARMDGE